MTEQDRKPCDERESAHTSTIKKWKRESEITKAYYKMWVGRDFDGCAWKAVESIRFQMDCGLDALETIAFDISDSDDGGRQKQAIQFMVSQFRRQCEDLDGIVHYVGNPNDSGSKSTGEPS